MYQQKLGSYLRAHRKRVGLTQRQLAMVVGIKNKTQISRHERMHVLPPLLTAFAYEAVLDVPLGEMFAGVRQQIHTEVDERLRTLEAELQCGSAHAQRAENTARVLEWLDERRRESRYLAA